MKLSKAIKIQSIKKVSTIQSKENGFVLYEGKSRLDSSQDIVAIITKKTTNKKIGDMYQLWILNKDINPLEASKLKKDNAICGDCKLRQSMGGACYVVIFQAPNQIWKSYKRGNYKDVSLDDYSKHFTDKNIRFGAYGDPSALPIEILAKLKAYANNNTAYTHQWKSDEHQQLKTMSMASVDNVKEAIMAKAKGWRYFRVASSDSDILDNEIICPSVTRGTSCSDCNLCNGAKIGDKRKDIVIPAHGVRAKKFI